MNKKIAATILSVMFIMGLAGTDSSIRHTDNTDCRHSERYISDSGLCMQPIFRLHNRSAYM